MYLNSGSGGGGHIWRQRFSARGEFTPPEQITSGPTEEEGISMASDGRSFITAVGLTRSAVWVHDRKGERQISLEGVAVHPLFTSDGKKLLYLVGQSGSPLQRELWWSDLDSGHTEPLLRGFAVPAGGNRSPYGISRTADRWCSKRRIVKGRVGFGWPTSTSGPRHCQSRMRKVTARYSARAGRSIFAAGRATTDSPSEFVRTELN
jgi:hypothetical protein